MRKYSVFGLGEKRRRNRKKRPSLITYHRVGVQLLGLTPNPNQGHLRFTSKRSAKESKPSAAWRLSWAKGERCSGAIWPPGGDATLTPRFGDWAMEARKEPSPQLR